ncbi:MAG: DUF2189 domain-containing protein [Burkholderiales bacterium]|nr:DUF2189 domain-containing protein [Burkholderiales bacterium]
MSRTLPTDREYEVVSVPFNRPLVWLGRGWSDLMRCPLPGLLHGLVAALFGAALIWLGRGHFWFLAGAFSGFLLVAPLLATGLYAVSRSLAYGRQATLATALEAWRPRDSRLVRFGLLLALAGTGWVLTSASLITRFASAPVNSPLDFLRIVVLSSDDNHLFEAWIVLGSVLAAPIFASSVVAIPMLLDRPYGVLTAVTTSIASALFNPAAMALWATLILAFTLLGMGTLMIGMIVVMPWLAHSSWHAYRDLVRTLPIGDRR